MARPVLWDFVVTIGLSLTYIYLKHTGKFKLEISSDTLTSMMSDFISASISLAGFVLASLTIIVTFKDNMQSPKATHPNNQTGIEILFSGPQYARIITTFSWAIGVFIVVFILLSVVKFAIDEWPRYVTGVSLVIGGTMISLTILRTFWVLYQVVKLQIKKTTENQP